MSLSASNPRKRRKAADDHEAWWRYPDNAAEEGKRHLREEHA